MDMDGPASPPHSDPPFLLGQAWHASFLPTCPGSPALQHLQGLSKQGPGRSIGQSLSPPLPFGDSSGLG